MTADSTLFGAVTAFISTDMGHRAKGIAPLTAKIDMGLTALQAIGLCVMGILTASMGC
jgi:hypothetical protein